MTKKNCRCRIRPIFISVVPSCVKPVYGRYSQLLPPHNKPRTEAEMPRTEASGDLSDELIAYLMLMSDAIRSAEKCKIFRLDPMSSQFGRACSQMAQSIGWRNRIQLRNFLRVAIAGDQDLSWQSHKRFVMQSVKASSVVICFIAT